MQQQDKNADARLEAALAALANKNYGDFLTGVERYHAAPHMRALAPPPWCWQEGSTQLLDFADSKNKPPVLVIPSLINRYHVLDLDVDQSLMRDLAKHFTPYLINWDAPSEIERTFNLDAYFEKRLLPVLEFINAKHQSRVHVVGYCMGGTLAAALGQIAPDKIQTLTFLAAPWDFHGDMNTGFDPHAMEAMAIMLEPILEHCGEMPADLLQSFFISQQPFYLHDKFTRFAYQKDEAALRRFVLIEDWVNDGVALSRHVAQDCFKSWYGQNLTLQKKWKVLGRAINPSQIAIPNLHVIPLHDKIVPHESALALAQSMNQATIITPSFGHISMMTHAAARDNLWPKLFDWLASHQ